MKILAIEGIDGTGKTTLGQALAQSEVEGHTVWVAGEMKSELGPALRRGLSSLTPVEKVFWFAADRASTLVAAERMGNDGPTLVVWDRYVDSARAYRWAEVQLGWAPPSILKLVENVNATFPEPLVTVFLDADPRDISKRLPDPIGQADARLPYVVDFYRARAERYPDRYVTVDATQSMNDVVDEVRRRIGERLR